MWWTAVSLLWLLLTGPGPPTTLSGRVIDESGARVEGAEVRLFRRDAADALEQREGRHAWTAPSGEFRFEGVPAAASYDVLATAPGFTPARLPVTVPRSAADARPVQLVLRRGVSATGMVVDGRGRPIPNARVELVRSLDGRLAAGAVPSLAEDGLYHATTGSDGRFQIVSLPAGRYQLILRASGFAPLERAGLELAASSNLGRFTLERGIALEGRVFDPDGRPISEAEVWVVPRNPRDWQAYYRQGPAVRSGPEGEFKITELRRGEGISLDVCRPGYLPISLSVREVPGEPLEIWLERAARIAGRAVDPEGHPVAGARLSAWLSGDSPQRPESLRPCHLRSGSATAGGDGRFTLEPLPPGWWTVRASANGWLDADSERREILGGQSLDGLEIVLAKGAIVTGRVLSPDGAPASGAEVRAYGERSNPKSLSGQDGVYRLDGVETGERTLEATHPDYAFAAATSRIEAGENRLDLTLERDLRHEIRGRVVDLNSRPVGGARVTVLSGSSAYSAGDGAFVLREREGIHEVWADQEGYAPAQARVTVADGPVNGVEIRLSPGGSIQGRLLGLDRDLLAGATVEVALPPPFRQQSTVDAQGQYRLTGLPPGLWEVTARAAGRSLTDKVELAPDDRETILDLLFPSTSEVSGWVLDADGQPVADALVRLYTGVPGRSGGWTLTHSDGGFRLEVEDGTYRAAALKRGYLSARLEEPVQVEGAPVDGLEMRLGQGTILHGRILGLEPGERAREVWAQGPEAAVRQGELDQQAQYSVLGLTPGEWKITAVFEGRQAAAAVTVEEGDEEVFLDLAFPSFP